MKNLRIFLLLPLVFLIFTSCSTLKKGEKSSQPAITTATPKPSNSTYDFKDIQVPDSMKMIPDDSILIETDNLKTGLMSFEGRVDPVSLFDFFVASMPNNGWELRSYFKYRRYMLIFEKSHRDCVIRISPGLMSTKLEIWVTPHRIKTGVTIQ